VHVATELDSKAVYTGITVTVTSAR